MKLKNSLQSIIFDFDGVILDSNKIKSEAFREALFDEEQAMVEVFIDYHKRNGGISRFKKIAYFYDVLKKSDGKNKITEKIDLFGKIVNSKLQQAEFIPGVVSFLEKCKQKNILCYVCSGGKEDELIDLAIEKEIYKYFQYIFGSPKTKLDIMRVIKDKGGVGPETIYFGDALSDYHASSKYSVDFIFVKKASEWKDGVEFCKTNRISIIEDFTSVTFE